MCLPVFHNRRVAQNEKQKQDRLADPPYKKTMRRRTKEYYVWRSGDKGWGITCL